MSVAAACVAGREQLEQLDKDFPAWHPWRSRTGRWWATRRGNIRPRRDRPPEWMMTIDGESADELRVQLKIQDDLPDGLGSSGDYAERPVDRKSRASRGDVL